MFKRFLIPAVALLAMTMPAPGQLFFKKKPAPGPQRVSELVLQVNDPDERKRSAAVTELREHDAALHPEVVTALAQAARDPKQAVRLDALSSLAKVRPVTALAGQTLENAAANDDNLRVRLHAKALMVSYNWSGYRHLRNDVAKQPTPAPAPNAPAPMEVARPILVPRQPMNEGPTIVNVPSSGPTLQAVPVSTPRPVPAPVVMESLNPTRARIIITPVVPEGTPEIVIAPSPGETSRPAPR